MEVRDFTTFMIDKSSFCLFEQAQSSCHNPIHGWSATCKTLSGFLKQNKNEQGKFACVTYLPSFMVNTRFPDCYLCFRRRFYFLLFSKDAACLPLEAQQGWGHLPWVCRNWAAQPFGWLCWHWELSYTQSGWQRWRISTIWHGKCTFPFVFLNHLLRAKRYQGQLCSRSAGKWQEEMSFIPLPKCHAHSAWNRATVTSIWAILYPRRGHWSSLFQEVTQAVTKPLLTLEPACLPQAEGNLALCSHPCSWGALKGDGQFSSAQRRERWRQGWPSVLMEILELAMSSGVSLSPQHTANLPLNKNWWQ